MVRPRVETLLEEAIKVAQANPITDLPKMAALIYDRKKLISVGMNSRKSHPLAKQFQKHPEAICTHAEIAAIVNAMRQGISVEGMSMYIARIGRLGYPLLAKPCIGCSRALISFGLKNVYWTENTHEQRSHISS